MLAYQICSDFSGRALAVDPASPRAGGHAIMAPANAKDPDQQWLIVFEPLSSALMLYNAHRDLAAAAQPYSGAPIVLGAPAPNAWSIVGDVNSRVIRCASNGDYNLTQGGGAQVTMQTWMRGEPNQLWRLVEVAG